MTLVGAGNIARCDGQHDEQTALLLDVIPGTVFTTGENVHANGSPGDFQACYGPSWGRHAARTRPALGEVEYRTAGAAGYFGYFGAAAGEPGKGFYSYELGAWHIVVLNSSVAMAAGSAQVRWLKADLAATTQPCVLAYWHFPRFSSYSTAVRSEVKPLWDALYAARADVVLNGHYRLYERFAPQTPAGGADPARGLRQFTVGTGGQGIDGISAPRPNSEVRSSGAYGVLKLTLDQFSFAWEFVPVAGETFRDAGDAACHGRPGGPAPPNQAPTAQPGGPYRTEGTVMLDGSASRDIDQHLPLTYAWDFGDGTRATGATPVKAYTADGPYAVSLIVTDARGLRSSPANTLVTVGNLPPVVRAGADTTVQIGSAFTLDATFSDPGGPADAPWTWIIAWGDGAITNGGAVALGARITASHAYRKFGDYTVRVSVTDTEGGTATDETVVTVRDPNAVVVLVGAGDIAECGTDDDERTAALLDSIPGIVFTVGDNAYLEGSAADFANCYQPTWGRHKARTRPAVGNHEYSVPGAAGYFGYFGAAAGDPAKGYYSYTAGEWLVIVLNSASGSINRRAGSAQERWLRALLASTTRQCALAYMHHPQFTSTDGRHTGEWNVIDLWNALYDGGVELVIAGHDHVYDRFAPMRPDGTPDARYGIRQITVGTGGGEGLYKLGIPHPNSQTRNNIAPGVLKLTLSGTGYGWQFVPVAGQTYTDRGTGTCHGRPGRRPGREAPPSPTPPTEQPGGRPTPAPGRAAGPTPPAAATPKAPDSAKSVVLVGAGQIARCDGQNDERTAILLSTIPGTVFTTGENVILDGSPDEFQRCYGPSWGRHAARTRPAPGEVEYKTPGAAGYFGFFGAAAGDTAKGYYSYDLGTWHIIVLNSNISTAVGSAQEQWLQADLAATTHPCVLAYWDHPRFSSSGPPVRLEVRPLWDALYAAGVDVVLNGHYRIYERFAPQTPTGQADPDRGIRQFTVGTGGQGSDRIGEPRPNSEVRSTGVYGVLKLTLDSDSYSWEFIPVPGQSFTDSGLTTCH